MKFIQLLLLACLFSCLTFSVSSQCDITSFVIEPLNESNCIGEVYEIQFDFNASDFGLQGFCVTDGVSTQCYQIGVDYIFTAQSDCNPNRTLTIFDQTDPDCSFEIPLFAICCPCEVASYTVTPEDCYQNNLTDLIHDIEIIGGSCFYEENWTLFIGDDIYPVTSDGTNLVSIGVELDESIEIIDVELCTDISAYFECISSSFTNPCFINQSDCEFLVFDFEGSLDCVDSFIVSDWVIQSIGDNQTGYDLFVDGVFHSFLDWNQNGIYPLEIESNDLEIMSLTVCVSDIDDCCAEIDFVNPCFENMDICEIGALDVEIGDCNDDNFVEVIIDFDFANVSDVFFVVGNGINYGTFAYSSLPITIGVEANCDIEYEFIVMDVNDNSCTNFIGVDQICCDSECEILVFDFEGSLDCINNFVVSEFVIQSIGDNQSGYDIFVDGEFHSFVEWDQSGLYVLEMENTGEEIIVLTACANDIDGCCADIDFVNPCFEDIDCPLDDIEIEVSECLNGLADLSIITEGLPSDLAVVNFILEDVIGDIILEGQIEDFGTLISEISFQHTPYFRLVFSSPAFDCITVFEFDNPCFQEAPCPFEISDQAMINFTCEDEVIFGSFTFADTTGNAPGVNVFAFGNFIDFVLPNDEGVYDFSFIGYEEIYIDIIICISDFPNCCVEFEVENPCILDNTDEQERERTVVYNNFTNQIITAKDLRGDLFIYDISGRVVKRFEVSENSVFDLSNLTSGIYFSMFLDANNVVQTDKFVVY